MAVVQDRAAEAVEVALAEGPETPEQPEREAEPLSLVGASEHDGG